MNDQHTVPTLAEEAELKRLNNQISAQPWFLELTAERRAKFEAERNQKIAVLHAEVADIDADCELLAREQSQLDEERAELHRAYSEGIAALYERSLRLQQALSPKRVRRSAAIHEMQELRGERPTSAPYRWLPPSKDATAPTIEEMKQRLPGPSSFAPKAIEVTTWVGNKLVTEIHYDRPPIQ